MGCKPSKEAAPVEMSEVPTDDAPAALAAASKEEGANDLAAADESRSRLESESVTLPSPPTPPQPPPPPPSDEVTTDEAAYPLAASREELAAAPEPANLAGPSAGPSAGEADEADEAERAVKDGELSRSAAASIRLAPPAVAPKPTRSPKSLRYTANPEEPEAEESAMDRAKRIQAQSLALAFKKSVKGKPLTGDDAQPSVADNDDNADEDADTAAKFAADDAYPAASAADDDDNIIKPKKAAPQRGGLAAMSMKIAQEAKMVRHVTLPLSEVAEGGEQAAVPVAAASTELPPAATITQAEALKTMTAAWARIEKQLQVDGVQPIKGDPKRKGWRVVRVFVSSTFADYFAERELLVKQIFPELRAWCQERRLFLVEVDLRWGVPKDSTSEATLRACLGELDRCRAENTHPFFLNMLGDRYGWMPAMSSLPLALSKEYDWVAGLSVTHMEILHGAFREKNPNALFFIRDSAVSAAVPAEFRASFVDEEPYPALALAELKARVRARFPRQTFDYTAKFDGVDAASGTRKPRLSGLESFKAKTLEFFQTAIERQYPLSAEPVSRLEDLADEHEDIIASAAGQVFGRETEVSALLQFAEEGIRAPKVARPPLIIATNPGMGKTAFAAAVCQAARQRRMHVIFHSAGASATATDFTILLERLGLELATPAFAAAVAGEGGNKGWTLGRLQEMLADPANMRNSGLPVVVLIDGIDTLTDGLGAESGLMLPATYPGRLSVVFTIESGFTNDKLQEKSPTPKKFDLPTLPKRWLTRIVEAHFEKFNKRLDQQQIDLLFANPASKNLRWLHIACEELRQHGAFETVNELISTFGDSVPKLLTQVLARLTRDNPAGLAKSALALIAASNSGLSEVRGFVIPRPHCPGKLISPKAELCALLSRLRGAEGGGAVTAAEWAVTFGQISIFTRPAGVGRLSLIERDVEHIVVVEIEGGDGTRKASDKCTLRQFRRCLADYFETVPDVRRKNSEYPTQLLQLNDKTKLLAYARSSCFEALNFSARYSVIKKLQCPMIVPSTPEPPGEVYCVPCSMKFTLNPRFMNKMVCCMCGGLTFSGAHLQPGTEIGKVALSYGDQQAVKCQKHRALGNMHKKCIICAAIVDPRFALPALACRHCANPHSLSCCFMG